MADLFCRMEPAVHAVLPDAVEGPSTAFGLAQRCSVTMQTVHICIWTSDSVLRMRRKRLSVSAGWLLTSGFDAAGAIAEPQQWLRGGRPDSPRSTAVQR